MTLRSVCSVNYMYVHDLIRSISISVHSYLGIRLLPMISNIVLKFSKNLYINLHKIKLLRIGIRKLVSKIGIVLVFKWWKEFPILQFCIWKFPWYDSIQISHIGSFPSTRCCIHFSLDKSSIRRKDCPFES